MQHEDKKQVSLLRTLVRPSSYTPGAARQRRIIIKTPITTAGIQGRRTVTSASSRLRRSRRETEISYTVGSRQLTKDSEFHDVTDEELREKRRQKLDHPKVMQKMYEKACVKYKVVPVRQYWEIPDTHIITLTNYNLGPHGVQALSVPLMLHESITKLDLAGNDMGVDGTKCLVEALQGNTSLTDLNLAENKLMTEGAVALKEFLREHPCLERLNLSGNGFKDDDSIIFGQVMKENQRLKHVDFSHNQFADNAGLQFRYVMSDTENLETFIISWNHLRRKGAMDLLAGVKKNFGLRSLDVSFNGFASEGAAVMANVLKKNRTLQEIDMRHNRLMDKDIINIAEKMDCNDALKVLKLGDNHFSHIGALALLTTLLNPDNVVSLELLDLGTTYVDEEFDFIANELKTSRQNLKIIYGKVIKKKRILPKHLKLEITDESQDSKDELDLPKASQNSTLSGTEDLVFSEAEAKAEKADMEKALLANIENANEKYLGTEQNELETNKDEEGLHKASNNIDISVTKSDRIGDSKSERFTSDVDIIETETVIPRLHRNEKEDNPVLHSDKTNVTSFDPKNLFTLQRQTFIEKDS